VLTGNFRRPASESENAFKHLRYLVRGRVQDENGNPVEGAALLIGDELTLTNAAGEFAARQKAAAPLRLQVAIAEFLNPTPFRVISAPPAVTPALDNAAPLVIVTLGKN
jgi:hypothetical protein